MNTNRNRGHNFEREIVNQAKAAGLEAERAWGSNGRSLGELENVDCKVAGLNVQCKRKRKLAAYLVPDDNVDIQAFRQDRGETYVCLKWEKLLELLGGNQ